MKTLVRLVLGLVFILISGAIFAAPEEAVLVEFSISGKMGTKNELQNIFALEDALEKAIKSAGVGEFDGNEIGEGKCVLFMYGPNAKKLFKAIEPIVRRSPLTKGGVVRLRFGPPGSREEQIKL
jgi:hypothetical protein